MPEMRTCPSCGARTPAGARFCERCGAQLAAPAEEEDVVTLRPAAPSPAPPQARPASSGVAPEDEGELDEEDEAPEGRSLAARIGAGLAVLALCAPGAGAPLGLLAMALGASGLKKNDRRFGLMALVLGGAAFLVHAGVLLLMALDEL